MIQFFRFDTSGTKEGEYRIISGREAFKFFLKRSVWLVLFVYSTLFLTVAVPFVRTPFIPIYFIGGMATSIFLMRFINHIVKYRKFSGGWIALAKTGITVSTGKGMAAIKAEDITYLECNVFGNLVIRQKYEKVSFPAVLISDGDRESLYGSFQDMAPMRTRFYRKAWEFVDAIAVALVLAVHIIQFVIQAYYIPTGSMEDTLKIGDHLFVEKITYGPIIPRLAGMDEPVHLSFLGIRSVMRGDIVIFRPPHEIDKDYIKRCIAIPGDRFEIRDGFVWINGKKTDEPYVKGNTTYDNFIVREHNKIEGVVPAGKLVVLGDNRNNSQDGRFFGYLDIKRIKGKAFILYWNTERFLKFDFSRFGLIK